MPPRPLSPDREFITSDTEIDPKFTLKDEDIAFKFPSSLHYLFDGAPSIVQLRDLTRLPAGQWWNDALVDYALSKSTLVCTSHFYTQYTAHGYESIQKWSKRRDPFTYQNIVIPVHLGNHWLVVIICDPSLLTSDHPEQRALVFSLDSLGDTCEAIRKSMCDWLLKEAEMRSKPIISPPVTMSLKVALQPNTCDCGPYMVHNLDRFMRHRDTLVAHIIMEQLMIIWHPKLAKHRRRFIADHCKVTRRDWIGQDSIDKA
ncbi:hypothetical protein M422DRAFT_784562 [Sphaerobolus stellatus SS14]|uniref:Ubiquitin-like protease family profile domain-containing protein n=1 Tax=Sphaerobolus stellatus (strain SS14) TaxID=990650 RepID=A0A0C9UHP6_SPHS4|nr:hypothetical protein M422DRAFT_784562 [Sphaerobolus stellatus SS14]